MAKSDKWEQVNLIYSLISGKITGTETYTYREDGETRTNNYNMILSKDWNFIHSTGDNGIYNATTSLPAGATLEWGLRCYED